MITICLGMLAALGFAGVLALAGLELLTRFLDAEWELVDAIQPTVRPAGYRSHHRLSHRTDLRDDPTIQISEVTG